MSTLHTPGPWTVRDMPTTHGRYIGPAQDGGACSTAFVVSSVSRSDAELDANARLIAAAPDMLAALQLLAASSFLPTVGTTRAAVTAAIAKATGSAA